MNKKYYGYRFGFSVLALFAAPYLTGCSATVTAPAENAASEEEAEVTGAAAVISELTQVIVAADIAQYDGNEVAEARIAFPNHLASTDMDNNYWTTADSIVNMYCGDDQECGGEEQFVSPQTFLDDQLNPDFTTLPGNDEDEGAAVGLMGRLTSTMKFACALTYMIGTDEDGLPEVGENTMLVSNDSLVDANAFCGSNLTLPEDAEIEVTMDVTEVEGTFNRYIHIESAMFENHVYIYDDGTVKRVLTSESNEYNGYNQVSRYFLQYDEESQIGHFEGMERGFVNDPQQVGGYYYYRARVNQDTGDVKIAGVTGGNALVNDVVTLTSGIMFAGSGNFNESQASWGLGQIENNSFVEDHPKLGCINMETGAFASAGACEDFPLDGDDLDAYSAAVITGALSLDAVGDWTISEEIEALDFDADTIFSADVAN